MEPVAATRKQTACSTNFYSTMKDEEQNLACTSHGGAATVIISIGIVNSLVVIINPITFSLLLLLASSLLYHFYRSSCYCCKSQTLIPEFDQTQRRATPLHQERFPLTMVRGSRFGGLGFRGLRLTWLILGL